MMETTDVHHTCGMTFPELIERDIIRLGRLAKGASAKRKAGANWR
jgi:hypothetical protein